MCAGLVKKEENEGLLFIMGSVIHKNTNLKFLKQASLRIWMNWKISPNKNSFSIDCVNFNEES